MRKYSSAQSGLSLIATILTLLIFSLFIAVAVSLVTTGSNVGVMELQGQQALFIADGGLQYTLKKNNFPNFGVSPAVNLGKGSFTTSVPTLSAAINNAVVAITVSSTDGFTLNQGDLTNYWVMLCDNDGADNPTATPNPNLFAATANCEKISFTGKTATPATFTGGTRGRDSSTPDTHQQNAVVLMYSWNPAIITTTARNFRTAHVCATAATTICVNSTANFADSGFIRINEVAEDSREDVFYSGKGTLAQCGTAASCPSRACLGTNGCTRRAYDDDTANPSIDHNGVRTIYQSEISVLPTSTGVIPGTIITGNVRRTIQISVLPLQ